MPKVCFSVRNGPELAPFFTMKTAPRSVPKITPQKPSQGLSLKARATQTEIHHPFREPRRKDPFRTQRKKPGEPSCQICGSLFRKGKWISAPPSVSTPPPARLFPTQAVSLKKTRLTEKRTPSLKNAASVGSFAVCPACKQLKERSALGVVELRGEHWRAKEEEILNLIKNTEKIARKRNDQERILWRHTRDGVTKIYVSLPELARHLGRALHKTYKGKTEYRRSPEDPFLRVIWHSASL